MTKTIGIRREDKNEWERRVPLIPEHSKDLFRQQGISTILQPSDNRIYTEDEFLEAGATINEDLSNPSTLVAVKEIPLDFIQNDKTYIFFSHVIKGQSYNMPLLRRLMDARANLIDYERIVNENNQRLIFFGKYAGLAGMIETFYAYRQKLEAAGIDSPFSNVKQAYEYNSVDEARKAIAAVARDIQTSGLPEVIGPVVVGIAGYGNVSKGAQEILELLPIAELSPAELLESYGRISGRNKIFKVIFKEKDMFAAKSGDFALQDYYDNPGNYTSIFSKFVPKLTMLVNCIFWTDAYPKLLTKEYLQNDTDANLKLKVVGDISCDIDGSIEITHKITYPDAATFTYYPESDSFKDGTQAAGVTVMAIDNLPCEFSRESSAEFSNVLKEYIPAVVNADFNVDFADLDLPYPIKAALILHQGTLTSDYEYLNEYLEKINE